mgnify:CR=1 FL=1
MSDDIFDFDIDAALETAEVKAAEKAAEVPEAVQDESDCEGCKIWFCTTKQQKENRFGGFFVSVIYNGFAMLNWISFAAIALRQVGRGGGLTQM